jgi:hypothetical protein
LGGAPKAAVTVEVGRDDPVPACLRVTGSRRDGLFHLDLVQTARRKRSVRLTASNCERFVLSHFASRITRCSPLLVAASNCEWAPIRLQIKLPAAIIPLIVS